MNDESYGERENSSSYTSLNSRNKKRWKPGGMGRGVNSDDVGGGGAGGGGEGGLTLSAASYVWRKKKGSGNLPNGQIANERSTPEVPQTAGSPHNSYEQYLGKQDIWKKENSSGSQDETKSNNSNIFQNTTSKSSQSRGKNKTQSSTNHSSSGGSKLSHSKNRQLYSTGLSDFLSEHVLGNEDYTSVDPSWGRKTGAANLAVKMALDHFMFTETQHTVQSLFLQHLKEETFQKGDVVCKEQEMGKKLFVVESGTIRFYINNRPVGENTSGGVFGELSLVYGIERSATVVCVSDCTLWR